MEGGAEKKRKDGIVDTIYDIYLSLGPAGLSWEAVPEALSEVRRDCLMKPIEHLTDQHYEHGEIGLSTTLWPRRADRPSDQLTVRPADRPIAVCVRLHESCGGARRVCRRALAQRLIVAC